MTDTKELTAFDIVELLRSPRAVDRSDALEALYPGETVALVQSHATGQSGLATTKALRLPGLFTAFCWAAQQIGETLGLQLGWVKTPEDGKNKILIARGG